MEWCGGLYVWVLFFVSTVSRESERESEYKWGLNFKEGKRGEIGKCVEIYWR